MKGYEPITAVLKEEFLQLKFVAESGQQNFHMIEITDIACHTVWVIYSDHY